MGKIRVYFFLAAAAILLCSFTSCGVRQTKETKGEKVEFTVLKEEEIPQELKTMIEDKKKTEFKMTYEDGEFMYIATGYGEQKTGGYSISVLDFYKTENALYLDTNLIGPSAEEKGKEVFTYPYIVAKCEKYDLSVVFQ